MNVKKVKEKEIREREERLIVWHFYHLLHHRVFMFFFVVEEEECVHMLKEAFGIQRIEKR